MADWGPIRALTLMQPWATLIAIGAKRIETRSWHPRENPGVIAITSSKKPLTKPQLERCNRPPFVNVLGTSPGKRHPLPLGVIVAVAVVRGFERTDEMRVEGAEADFGDFSPGRWAWHLGEVVALAEPIRVTGAQGLWKIPSHLIDNDGRPGPLVRAIGGRGEYRRLLQAAHG